MSSRPGWPAAMLLVLAVNAACLGVWYWNRWGSPVATVELTERELGVVRGGEDNTLLRLNLQYHDPGGPGRASPWADSASFVALGFRAERLSTGQEIALPRGRPHRRPAWVLLRIDLAGDTLAGPDPDLARSRLVPVGVGTDPIALYRAAGDRENHLVLRGVVGVYRYVAPPDSVTGVSEGETWSASLHLLSPRFLHVPRSLVPVLNRLAPTARSGEVPRYAVRISMGRLQLPWVTGIFPAVR